MTSKRTITNRLNNLDPKSWIKFQKSWFIHNPPPRQENVFQHPAKFPETLAQDFIEFFTKTGQYVLDPMVGTGSTQIAALRTHRHSYGIELNPNYAQIARDVIQEERSKLGENFREIITVVITGDASRAEDYFEEESIPLFDYLITSPPYWNMLRMQGSNTQKKRRLNPDLDVYYSDNTDDLGNINDYQIFLNRLIGIYTALKPYLKSGAYLTIIVKNVKKKGKIYPLAWDIAQKLGEVYQLKDEKIWCQDDIKLFPYGLGKAWVSNTFHHYCLQFRNE